MPIYEKVISNKIRCRDCGDVIESRYCHDFKFCKCGAVAVDGGREYLRRVGKLEAIEELSETMQAEYEEPDYLKKAPGEAIKK
jgi:hypothetical protein